MKIYFYILSLALCVICIPVISACHEPQCQDTLKANSLMLGMDYSSNTSSFGRFSGVTKQPSYSGFASFYSRKGFSAGLSSVAIDNSDSSATTSTYEYDLNLGYDWNFSKYFTLTGMYSHFFYSRNSYSLKSLYNDEFQLGVNYKSGVVFANASGYYLLGDYNEWMNSGQLGVNLQIDNVFFKNHSISFSPEINTIMSNQKYYDQYAYKTYWYLYRIAKQSSSITIGDLYDSPEKYFRIWRYLNNRPRVLKNFKELDQHLILSDLFKADNNYNFSSVSFVLPVYYNFGNFSLNFSYSFTLPLNVPEYFDNSGVSYISAGIFYTFLM